MHHTTGARNFLTGSGHSFWSYHRPVTRSMAGLWNMVRACQLHLLLFLLLFPCSVTEAADGGECWPFPSR